MKHKFPYEWTLKDANFTKDKGSVFSCFSCGGGSTMGYKLAGFDVIGCNEIDPKMMEVYKLNHNPKYSYLESITTFKNRKDLPKDLYNLDILDGSPPCSSFSMAGNREKDWGKKKKFKKGQQEQVLDTLFFDFIDLATKLQPKVVVAENVKGLLQGNAKQYVIGIYKQFDKAGYCCQHWLLNASKMGVPQRRERVFFICLRKDMAKPFLYQRDLFTQVPVLDLVFDEDPILFKDICDGKGRILSDFSFEVWKRKNEKDRKPVDTKVRIGMKYSNFNARYVRLNEILPTIDGKGMYGLHLFNKPVYASNDEMIKGGSFTEDYNFNGKQVGYVIGLSVPPVMTAQIATRIYEQWLNKL